MASIKDIAAIAAEGIKASLEKNIQAAQTAVQWEITFDIANHEDILQEVKSRCEEMLRVKKQIPRWGDGKVILEPRKLDGDKIPESLWVFALSPENHAGDIWSLKGHPSISPGIYLRFQLLQAA